MDTNTTLDRIEKGLLNLMDSEVLSIATRSLLHVAWLSVVNARGLEDDLDHRGKTYLAYLLDLKPAVYPTTTPDEA